MNYQYQVSLFDRKFEKLKADKTKIKMLFWNIQNPSLERAKKQLEWIYSLNVDIVILTEVKLSKGFYFLKIELEQLGYETVFTKSEEYFTVIALRGIKFVKKEVFTNLKLERVVMIEMYTFIGKINLIGTYIPTNNIEPDKAKIKERFHDNILQNIRSLMQNSMDDTQLIFGGDLNILEPGHKPYYPQFTKWEYFYKSLKRLSLIDVFRQLNPAIWEYTWEERGKHQRLDYIFVTPKIMKYVEECKYIHKPRILKLSDHSAQLLVLANKNKLTIS